ncbi:MAG: hypothetical protein AAFU85_10120 [Planctomycetota bacterium]
MPIQFHDVIGFVGIALIVGCYLLLQTERLRSDDIKYSIFNGIGAICILVSLCFEFNLSAFIVETIWVLISLVGIGRYFLNKRRSEQTDSD